MRPPAHPGRQLHAAEVSAGAPALLWLTVSRVCCPGRRGDCLSAQALNCTARLLPFRRPRALHLTATEPAGGGPAATGVDSSAHDASYHTPSPASQRQLPPPLAPQPTPITAAMSSAAWLQGTVAGQGEGPPPQLRALMQAAGMDAGAPWLSVPCRCLCSGGFRRQRVFLVGWRDACTR